MGVQLTKTFLVFQTNLIEISTVLLTACAAAQSQKFVKDFTSTDQNSVIYQENVYVYFRNVFNSLKQKSNSKYSSLVICQKIYITRLFSLLCLSRKNVQAFQLLSIVKTSLQ